MADVTPTDAFLGSKAVLTFGSNTYHGITNYSWSGSVQQQVIRFSTSSGTGIVRLGGSDTDAEDDLTLDMVIAPGDYSTIAALKRGTTSATCEFHPEADSAGNIEFTFEAGLITNSSFAGSIDSGGVLSITIACNGTLTVQAAT